MTNVIYAVKGGIPSVGHSTNPNFYLLCYDFDSNIGYIEEKERNSWTLYTRSENLLKSYRGKEEKFYYHGTNFKDCVKKLQKLSGRIIKELTTDEVEKLKGKMEEGL